MKHEKTIFLRNQLYFRDLMCLVNGDRSQQLTDNGRCNRVKDSKGDMRIVSLNWVIAPS